MFYVVFLLLLSFGAWPLRSALRTEADPYGGGHACFGVPDRTVCLVLYGTMFVGCYMCYIVDVKIGGAFRALAGNTNWEHYVEAIFVNLMHFVTHTFGFGALVSLHVFLRRRPDGIFTWLMLAYIYLPVLLFPTKIAYGPHMIMLYLIGVIVKVYPFYGAALFAKAVRAYWLIIVACPLLILQMPELVGRCDTYPPLSAWERFRWYFCELLLLLLLLTRSLEATDPFNILTSLGWWALFAFCSHVMFARTLPAPYGAILEFGLIPLFVLGFYLWDKRKPPRSDSPGVSSVEPILGKREPYGTFGGESMKSEFSKV